DTVDTRFVLSAEGTRRLDIGNRNYDSRWFLLRIPWINGIRVGALTYAPDSVGGGRIEDASIIRELSNGEDEFVRATVDARLERINYDDDGRATVAFENFVDAKRVISAFSTRRARADRVEMPLERAHHRPLGRFDPFTVVTGSVAEIGDTRIVRTTRRLARPDWLDEVFRDKALLEVLPSTLAAPSGGVIGFTARVPSAGGNLAVVAGTTAGPVFTLGHAWFEPAMMRAAGSSGSVDLGAGGAAGTTFTVVGGTTGLDAALTAADFSLDWAVEFDDGKFVDVARDVGGNHAFAGSDITIQLPDRSGDFAGARHLVALTGSATSGGATLTQRSLAEFEGPQSAVTLHPVPTISQPAPGAMVSTQGFTVDFTVPTGTTFLVIQLRQETTDPNGDVIRDWTALMPPDDTSFEFRRLPGAAPTPLDVGAYTLTLTAARVETGPLTREDFQYERINARWVGLSWADFEVNAVSSVSIPLTLF
ncbi:MAG: hypothetical protein KDB80_02030, partial [Planctomycetes bacterium]|nr:hypothetical protein [Planctomycetota bacterium]